jgi:hypothetical protein
MYSAICSAPCLVVEPAHISDVELVAPLFDAYRQFYGAAPDLPAARAPVMNAPAPLEKVEVVRAVARLRRIRRGRSWSGGSGPVRDRR